MQRIRASSRIANALTVVVVAASVAFVIAGAGACSLIAQRAQGDARGHPCSSDDDCNAGAAPGALTCGSDGRCAAADPPPEPPPGPPPPPSAEELCPDADAINAGRAAAPCAVDACRTACVPADCEQACADAAVQDGVAPPPTCGPLVRSVFDGIEIARPADDTALVVPAGVTLVVEVGDRDGAPVSLLLRRTGTADEPVEVDAACLGGVASITLAHENATTQAASMAVLSAARIEIGGRVEVRSAAGSCGGLALLSNASTRILDGGEILLAGNGNAAGCGGFAGASGANSTTAPDGAQSARAAQGGAGATAGDESGPRPFGSAQLVPLVGGGGGGANDGASGGGGGGALYLASDGIIEVLGAIDVRGGDATGDVGTPSGGGAGGAVLVEGARVRFSGLDGADVVDGVVKLRGGNGVGGGARGGPGRLRIADLDPGGIPRSASGSGKVQLADEGADTDGPLCLTVVQTVATRTVAADPTLRRHRAPTFPVATPVLRNGAPIALPAGDVALATGTRSAVFASGRTYLVVDDAGAVGASTAGASMTNDAAIDALAVDDSGSRRVALGIGSEIVISTDGSDATPLHGVVARAAGPVAIAQGVVVWRGVDGALQAHDVDADAPVASVPATSSLLVADPATSDPAPNDVLALAGRGDVIAVALAGDGPQTASRGVGLLRVLRGAGGLPGFSDKALEVVPSEFGFIRALPSALDVAVADDGSLQATVGVADDNRCGAATGAVVFGQRVATNPLRQRFVVDSYDPRTRQRFGSTVSRAGDVVATTTAGGPAFVLREIRGEFVADAIIDGAWDAAAVVLVAGEERVYLVDAARGLFVATIPPAPPLSRSP